MFSFIFGSFPTNINILSKNNVILCHSVSRQKKRNSLHSLKAIQHATVDVLEQTATDLVLHQRVRLSYFSSCLSLRAVSCSSSWGTWRSTRLRRRLSWTAKAIGPAWWLVGLAARWHGFPGVLLKRHDDDEVAELVGEHFAGFKRRITKTPLRACTSNLGLCL